MLLKPNQHGRDCSDDSYFKAAHIFFGKEVEQTVEVKFWLVSFSYLFLMLTFVVMYVNNTAPRQFFF